jgi:glycosyltransferase involved in cell wall biosynthesis
MKATADKMESSPAIYIVTTQRETGETGVHTHFLTVRDFLRNTGNPVLVLTPYDSWVTLRRIVGIGMRVILHWSKEFAWRFRDFFYAQLLWLRLRQVLEKDRSWIVYAQCPASVLAAQRLKVRSDQQIVLVTHFNGSHADEMVESGLIRKGGSFYKKIQVEERIALLNADRLVFVSSFLRDLLGSTVHELSQRPAIVLPNFIETPVPADDCRFTGDLASIGTLETRKNQVFLLHVLAAAKRKGSRYTLTLFGTGKPEAAWRQVAVDLGIADQVTFAGFTPQASRYLHGFRAYVHAAKIENLPISLVEALACGLLVFAARVGGIPEVVDEGVTGFFWDLNDPEQSADLLIRVLEDEPLRTSMGSAAREAYHARFSTSLIAPRLAAWVTQGTNPEDQPSSCSVAQCAMDSDRWLRRKVIATLIESGEKIRE